MLDATGFQELPAKSTPQVQAPTVPKSFSKGICGGGALPNPCDAVWAPCISLGPILDDLVLRELNATPRVRDPGHGMFVAPQTPTA